MRYLERIIYARKTIQRPPVSEADAEPKPIPVEVAMWVVFLLALGLWAVIWVLAKALG